MSESSKDGNDNIKTSDLATTDETLLQDTLDAEASEPQSDSSESVLLQDEIQITLKEFNQKINDNDRSIKRIEESMAALYDKLDRTPEVQESKTSSNKKLKKKEKKLEKKDKKVSKKLEKKGKKKKKLDKKDKKVGRKKKVENTNSTKADGKFRKK